MQHLEIPGWDQQHLAYSASIQLMVKRFTEIARLTVLFVSGSLL